MKNKINKQDGYTIIETMIAVSVFLVIIMSGMGALLNANLIHQKSQSMRSIMDNLSFVMEDISRNLRTGYNYHCIDGTGDGGQNGINTHSCPDPDPDDGYGISFESEGSRSIYYIGTVGNVEAIFKEGAGGGSRIQLTPDEVSIDLVNSVFVVTGAEPPPSDREQPFATIKLVGTITYKEVVTPFTLQTSISQSKVDI